MSLRIYLISLVFAVFFSGCSNIKHENDDNLLGSENQSVEMFKFDVDSLIAAAADTFASPEILTAIVPTDESLNILYSVTPGTSFLKQSVEEKIDNIPQIMSKSPAVTIVGENYFMPRKLKSDPEIKVLMKPEFVQASKIKNFKSSNIKEGRFAVQNGDTIIPPIRVYAKKPSLIPALPADYRDEAQIDISYLDSDQNLPNSFIRDIIKDSLGVMWFISHTGGMISYDGSYYRQYTVDNGLSNDMLLSACVDADNRLWIATQGSGINVFDGKTITQYSVDQGLPSDLFFDIIKDSKGNIWASYLGGIISIKNDTIRKYDKEQGLKLGQTTEMCETADGCIWVGTRRYGAMKLDGDMYTWLNKSNGLGSNTIFSVFQDHNYNMWFGSYGNGVTMFDGEETTVFSVDEGLGSNAVLTITEDRNNIMWFGTYGNGVTMYDGVSFTNFTYDEGLNDIYFRSLFADSDGKIYFGADGGGVIIIVPNGFMNITKENGLDDNLVVGMYEDSDGNMLMGDFQGGVLFFDKDKNKDKLEVYTKLSAEQGLANNIVVSIAQHPNGDYLFGTYENGLSILSKSELEKGKVKFSNYHINQGLESLIVRAVQVDSLGKIWLGTEAGITIINGQKVVSLSKKSGFPANNVLTIFEEKDHTLWFGTMDDGVITLKNDTLTKYTVDNGLPNNSVWTITQDYLGNIWFGTDGGGVSCFSGGEFYNYNADSGLCYNYVFSLMAVDTSIWVGTTRGLTQIILKKQNNIEPGFDPVFVNYGKNDGLKGVDFFTNSSYVDSKSRLWFGTDKALSMINYKDQYHNQAQPIININKITINNIDYDYEQMLLKHEIPSGIKYKATELFTDVPIGLKLNYDKNHLTFFFSALTDYAGDETRYQFKLDGLDDSWSPLTKEKIADYRNIPPGRYKFNIKAKDKMGNCSEYFHYSFVIHSPWWFQWWAFVLYFIVAVIIINLLIKWRVSLLQRQKMDLENMIFARTKELDEAKKAAEQANEVKSQFVATISHELRTPLNAIVGLIHLSSNTHLTAKQKKYLAQMDRSAKTLLGLINDILDFSKIEAGKLEVEKVPFYFDDIVSSISIINANSAFKQNLEFIINTQFGMPEKMIGDPLRIEQVINNLCGNALKFTAKGEIILNFTFEEKQDDKILFKVSVKDTGIGVSEEQKPQLFKVFEQADSSITRKYGGSGLGLSICKNLLDLMGGEIWFRSDGIGKGSEFGFSLLLDVDTHVKNTEIYIPDELRTFNILVCVSQIDIRNSVYNILSDYNIKCDFVNNVNDAIKASATKEFELVIFDNDVNECDKNHINKYFEENSNSKCILIERNVLMSDNVSKNIAFVEKPVLPKNLILTILGVFGMSDKENGGSAVSHFDDVINVIGDKKILISEDSEISQQVLKELLENVGFIVDAVSNGSDIFEIQDINTYDLILMDLHMPVMDGCTAAKVLKEKGIFVPVILVTADAFSIENMGCGEKHYEDVITKPVDPELLYSKIIDLFSGDSQSNIPDVCAEENKYAELGSLLDINNTLKRFGGNEKLFISMLKKFAAENIGITHKILNLLKGNSIDNASELVHKLKGESGTLGADNIFNLCVEIRNAIDENNGDIATAVAHRLQNAVDLLISQIKEFLDKNDNNQEFIEIRKCLDNLEIALNANSPDVFDLLDKIEASPYKEKMVEIRKCVLSGDNKTAIELVKVVKKTIKK